MKNTNFTFVLVICIGIALWPAYAQTTSDSFLSRAIEMNQAELELGRMAQGKAENPKVKEFADMMVRDHTQALEKLRSAAGVSEAQVPLTKEDQQLSDRLSGLSGSDFDKAYMGAMVKDHQMAVQTFQREAKNSGTAARQKPGSNTTNDAEIARELLPTLQKHLSEAEQIDRTIGRSGK